MQEVPVIEIYDMLDVVSSEIYPFSGNHPLDTDYIERVKADLLGEITSKKNAEEEKFQYLLYSFLKDSMTYFTFNDFYNALEKCSNDLADLLIYDYFDKIFFLIGNGNLLKSNFWVMLLFLDMSRNFFLENPHIMDKITVIGKDDIPDVEGALFVYFDDGIYSGTQIADNTIDISETSECFILCPFVSTGAEELLMSRKTLSVP